MLDQPATEDPKELARSLRERCGISPGYASEIANGKRTPSLAIATKIERELGIPAASWLDEDGNPARAVDAETGAPA